MMIGINQHFLIHQQNKFDLKKFEIDINIILYYK